MLDEMGNAGVCRPLVTGTGDDEKADKIELKHLKRVAKELNENMSEDELNEMITRADTDRDGKVSFDEFYNIMTKKI